MNVNRATQCLNGWWDYRVGDGAYHEKQIPYSDAPVGFAECKLAFDTDRAMHGKRICKNTELECFYIAFSF